MKKPLFIRRKMSYETDVYYGENTDIHTYGTPLQYEFLIDLLSDDNKSTTIINEQNNGMDLLILESANNAKKDFILLHERLVYNNDRFNMELIIGGTHKGKSKLIKYFKSAIKNKDNHYHIDEYEKLLFLPSVNLNIHSAEKEINYKKNHILNELNLIKAADYQSPEDNPYFIPKYEELHGRIPIKKKTSNH